MCKLLKPSVEKPWLKFFSEEAREASVPQNTIYRHLRENNENGLGDTALNYFGRKISPLSLRRGSQDANLSTVLPLWKPKVSKTEKGASVLRQLTFIMPVCLIM